MLSETDPCLDPSPPQRPNRQERAFSTAEQKLRLPGFCKICAGVALSGVSISAPCLTEFASLIRFFARDFSGHFMGLGRGSGRCPLSGGSCVDFVRSSVRPGACRMVPSRDQHSLFCCFCRQVKERKRHGALPFQRPQASTSTGLAKL